MIQIILIAFAELFPADLMQPEYLFIQLQRFCFIIDMTGGVFCNGKRRILIGLYHIPHNSLHLTQRQNTRGNTFLIRTPDAGQQHNRQTPGYDPTSPPAPRYPGQTRHSYPTRSHHCRSALYLLALEISILLSKSNARFFSSGSELTKILDTSFDFPSKKNWRIIRSGFSVLTVFSIFNALITPALPSDGLSYSRSNPDR